MRKDSPVIGEFDNTNGKYFYDETHAMLRETIKNVTNETAGNSSVGKPTLLCQFVTDSEIVLKDLLEIQNYVEDSPLTIINRWHMTIERTLPDGTITNPMTRSGYKAAGYMSIWNGEMQIDLRKTNEDDGSYNTNIDDFVKEHGIAAFSKCPECGNLTCATQIAVSDQCYYCTNELLRRIRESINSK